MDATVSKDGTPQAQNLANTSGAILLLIILFSFDELNPISVVCSYTGGVVSERFLGGCAAFWLFVILIHERSQILYYMVIVFFRCTINNMFFRTVEVIGLDNLPSTGPVILTGNHNNQFVDGLILLTNCKREISFLIAQKSYDRPVVGFFAKAFHCIPVVRPQDTAFKGDGLVFSEGTTKIQGQGTRFLTQVEEGAQLLLKGLSDPLKVKSVISDTELELAPDASAPAENAGVSYKVLPKVNQSTMYDMVYQSLNQGKCLGIFPEGGSHDRTDILPLKAGVAIIALGAYATHHINVPIVPVGLNYFGGHRFGGRVVVEFGSPIEIPETLYTQYEGDKRGAVDAVLQTVSDSMRGVIVPTPDFHTLQVAYMARRLFAHDGIKLNAEQSMDLSRRFAAGIDRIMQLSSREDSPTSSEDAIITEPSPEAVQCIKVLRDDIENYMTTLKSLGLRDHQVRQIGWWSSADLVGRLFYLIFTMALGAIPQVLFNVPLMVIARALAVGEQKKALQASKVKVAARDVVMSYKIIYIIVFTPILYVIYAILLFTLTSYSTSTVWVILCSLPAFSFLGMKASEQGFRTYLDVVPLFKRLKPQNRAKQDQIPALRAELQKRLRQAVKKYGSLCGDIYSGKKVNWRTEFRITRSISDVDVDAKKSE